MLELEIKHENNNKNVIKLNNFKKGKWSVQKIYFTNVIFVYILQNKEKTQSF